MNKSKWKKRKANKKPIKPSLHQQPAEPPPKPRRLSKIIKLLLGVVGFFATAISLYFTFLQSVSVSPDTSLNPNNAFSTPFSVCNESLFSIYNVSVNYKINHIFAENHVEVKRLTVKEPLRPIIPELQPKEATSVMISFFLPNKPEFCDVTINASYRPAFAWWQKSQTFRFITATNSEGQIVWYRKAQSELVDGQ